MHEHELEHALDLLSHKLNHVLLSLDLLSRKVDLLMALADDLKAGIAKLDAETTAIGTVIQGLVAKLQNPSITPQEQTDIFAALNAVSDRLTTLGTDPTNPVPPPPAPLQAAKKLAGKP